jgi:hypothetical protein
MKTYFKVLTTDLRSCIISNSRFATQYKIGEFVRSPIPETPLCVFTSKKLAQKFAYANIGTSYKIYSCHIKGKCPKPWVLFNCNEMNILKIKKLVKSKCKYMNHVDTSFLPSGTVCAKQVKLLEEIK